MAVAAPTNVYVNYWPKDSNGIHIVESSVPAIEYTPSLSTMHRFYGWQSDDGKTWPTTPIRQYDMDWTITAGVEEECYFSLPTMGKYYRAGISAVSNGEESAIVYTSVMYYKPSYTKIEKPSDLATDVELCIDSAQLTWDAGKEGTNNSIISYHIQYQDCADGTSWPNTWIDLETDWPASPLEVSPPNTVGWYRRFRIQVKGSAGSNYYSDWLISSNSLRKDMAPFEGFTDPELTALSTKIKAIHMTEMQNRINEILIFEGKQPYSFTQIVAGQTKLTGWTNHVNELRSALNQLDNLTVEWIEILENRPRVDVINQIRNVINLYN